MLFRQQNGNTLYCRHDNVHQFVQVYRVKNKWKFQLKDGVMHVGGFDYVFHKTNGEADW